jgi:hypothetical protein
MKPEEVRRRIVQKQGQGKPSTGVAVKGAG